MKDLIFYGGPILTMADTAPDAVLVRDGRIAGLGTMAEVEAVCASDAEKIDLCGRCLMPSFIDGHSHLTQFAQSLTAVDLSHCTSFDDIIHTLRDFRKRTGIRSGEVLCGYGYDHNDLVEKRHPDRFLLDNAFPDNPVVLSHVSGHMGVVSSEVLRQMGIDESWTVPSGGAVGKNEKGELTGYLEENAFFALRANAPTPSPDTSLSLLKQAQEIYLSYGITTAQDGMLDEGSFALLKAAAEQDALLCDVVGYADMKSCPDLIHDNETYAAGRYVHRLKLGGYKIFLDGSPQGRTAWMREPYCKTDMDPRENYRGYPIYTDEQVKAFTDMAISENRQLLAHCNGDAAAMQLIGAYSGHTDTRPVIIHGQFLPREALPEVKAKGLMPSYFVAHTFYWGDAHIENMGMDRAQYISPTASTAKLNIPFTFHQDTPVLVPDMIDTLWCAVNRKTKKGISLSSEERISVYDALKALTVNAAYQYFEEDQKGSIQVGKLADLVILSDDPTKIPPEDLRQIHVLATYKEGVLLYKREV